MNTTLINSFLEWKDISYYFECVINAFELYKPDNIENQMHKKLHKNESHTYLNDLGEIHLCSHGCSSPILTWYVEKNIKIEI